MLFRSGREYNGCGKDTLVILAFALAVKLLPPLAEHCHKGNNAQRRFGGEIDAEELQGLTYEKLEQFTGYYGLTKLLDVADSFKIRSWDGKNNFDYTMICEENGNVVINQIFVGIL